MKKYSAGLLVYRKKTEYVEVLLVHPGGPFWAKKDNGVWSIPKGEFEKDEDPKAAAYREFEEEIGQPAPKNPAQPLQSVTQKDNKDVVAWAIEGDLGEVQAKSNTFSIEWPPKSGKRQEFPEVDRAEWFELQEATHKLIPVQITFLQRLAQMLSIKGPELEESKQSTLF